MNERREMGEKVIVATVIFTIILYQTESLQLLHPISRHLKVCCLGQSITHLPSCVLVTVSS